jgi:NAD-dependent deacetylase
MRNLSSIIDELAGRDFRSIVVLTGAGISAESGIQTFRAADGLWENHRVEEVATPEGFAANPSLVQRFYNERRRHLLSGNIKPNPAHFALAQLEKNFGGDFLLVTQNIDNLHERAHSNKLIHMHGELLKMRCVQTGAVYVIESDIASDSTCECCGECGTLRPDIVWFGEMPMQMERVYAALAQCDLFLSIGTSGNVYPAAGFVQEANAAGAATIEINLEPSAVESQFGHHVYGKAGDVLPEFLGELLGLGKGD